MPSQLAEAIRQLTQEKGISEEAVLRTIENTLKAAYKRAFGTSDNCIVRFSEDNSSVEVFSRKVIVDGVYDPVVEIELEDALKLSPDCEIGDELDIAVDPSSFDRSAVQTGKQTVHQALSEIQKDSLYAEYKDKVGEIIIGYKFVITGDTNTSSNMSANGSMNGTVTCTHSTENNLVQGMYPGEAVYNNLQIKSGAAGGGSYGVTTRDLNGKEINKADVDWQVGEEIHK